MADPLELPISGAALAEALTGPVAFRNELLEVAMPTLVRGEDDVSFLLCAVVTATAGDSSTERWKWELPLQAEDLTLTTQSFVATVRANLEEWWITKDYSTDLIATGERIR
jgi:hypothetical protein